MAVHGQSTKDRPTPHIHIYLNNDVNPYTRFNFEISFVDLLCKDEIVPIYQRDTSNNLLNKNRKQCSWNGYADILNGLKTFFQEGPIYTKFGAFENNLERAIYEWNRETDLRKTESGGNPLKEYFDDRGLTPLPKYAKYLYVNNVVPSQNTYTAGEYVEYHYISVNSNDIQSNVMKNCIITKVIDSEQKQYQLFVWIQKAVLTCKIVI